jgi:ATP-dependent RNA helicase DDX10/DBP4
VYIQKDKEVFKVESLPLEEFAESLGLPTVPHVKFVPVDKIKQAKNAPHPVPDSDDENKQPKQSVKTKTERMFSRQNQTVLSKHYEDLHANGNTAFKLDETDDDSGDIFDKKRKINWDEVNISTGQLPV